MEALHFDTPSNANNKNVNIVLEESMVVFFLISLFLFGDVEPLADRGFALCCGKTAKMSIFDLKEGHF